jgi:uncharacterized protein YecT (DUF1311 family)
MMKLTATAAILVCAAGQAAWAEEGQAAQPSELTSRGVIAAAATEAYKEAIDSCPGIEPGSAPQGPKFVACLKRKLRSENETLVKTLNATASFLKPIPDRAAKLRNAQGAWIKFRDENCGFARLVAPQGEADAFYYDCLLRVTIDRRVELRSLVGD